MRSQIDQALHEEEEAKKKACVEQWKLNEVLVLAYNQLYREIVMRLIDLLDYNRLKRKRNGKKTKD
jgi:hypothetical protein